MKIKIIIKEQKNIIVKYSQEEYLLTCFYNYDRVAKKLSSGKATF